MKAIIEFNLDDPDDRQSYEIHNKAKDLAFLVWHLMTNKKKEIEYKLQGYTTYSRYDALDLVFEEIGTMLEEEGINIDKLVQ